MLFALIFLIVSFSPYLQTFAQETESFEIRANACEKVVAEESLSSARNRAVDKAVFLGLKNAPQLEQDKQRLNDHDLSVMIYRLVDDYVQDLTSKVTKSDKEKVCVEISGYINPQNIQAVRNEFKQSEHEHTLTTDDMVEIAANMQNDLQIKPQSMENLALVYVEPLQYFNGTTSVKYASFLKDKIKNSSYYFLTDKKDLADYVITPKLLKAKPENLDDSHKRIQMVVALEISGLQENITTVSQNRFLLYSAQENQNEIVTRLLKKLLEAAGMETVRKIEFAEQKKLEETTFGRSL